MTAAVAIAACVIAMAPADTLVHRPSGPDAGPPPGQPTEIRFPVISDERAGNYPCSVAIGLLDGDSIPDLAAANYGSNSVSVLLGNGDGTFRARREFPAAFLPYTVAIGDLNQDGRADLAVASEGSGQVTELLGDGRGGFSDRRDLDVGGGAYSVAVGDLDKDGNADLVASNLNQNRVTVLDRKSVV